MSKIRIEINRGEGWVFRAELENQVSLKTKEQIAHYISLYSDVYAHRAYIDEQLVAECKPGQAPEISPDITEEFVYTGSLVPRIPTPVRTYLVYGHDVPPKMVFVKPDVNEATLPYIVNNKKADGPYQYVDEVVGGAFKMHETPYRTGDQTNIDGNETIRQGTKKIDLNDKEEVATTALVGRKDKPPYGSAWMVKSATDAFILIIPECPDSFDVADTLADLMVGPFSVMAFKGGQLTIGEPVPGWTMLLAEKEDESMEMSVLH